MPNFVELKDFPGYFIAHSPARLRRVVRGKILECSQTPNSKQDNYWTVTVKTKEGKYVKRSMHRLLMETFVPNPLNKAHVNHIDGNKANNELSNLEWTTPQENSQHAIDIGLKGQDYKIKPVYQYTLSGAFLAEYPTHDQAQAATGVAKQNICKAAVKEREHAGYFQWRYYKRDQVSPVKKNYIKGYLYKGSVFNTIRELAESLELQCPEKVGIVQLKRKCSENLKILYHD